MGFDLSKNNFAEKAESGYEFELVIPEIQQHTGAFVTVLGIESKIVKNYNRKKFQEMQQREIMANKRKKELDPMTLEEAEDLAIDAAFVRLISWKGVEEDGKALVFNEENAKKVLREHSWIREQILTESGMLGNFM